MRKEHMTSFYSDGLKLECSFGIPNTNCPIIIVSHGGEGSRVEWSEWYPAFYDAGFGFLRFSHRGCGKSDGKITESSVEDRVRDFRMAITLSEALRIDHNKIGAIGSSAGGCVVSKVNDSRIKVMVIISAPTSDASSINVPLLIIHGENDETVPVKFAYELYQNSKEPKRLEIIKGGIHVLPVKPKIDFSLNWFKEHLFGN